MISTGSSQSQTSTTPWAGQAPYLQDLYSRAESLFNQPNYEYGPGRVAPFDPASLSAFQRTEDRGLAGSSVNRAAQGQLEDTISGKYLDPESNENLARYGDIGARSIRRNYLDTVKGLGSRMEASGRTGGSSHAVGANVADENFATGLGDFYARLYGGAYEGERGRMMGASGMAPAAAETDYRDLSAVREVGRQREGQAQNVLADLVARFNQEQYQPAAKLAEFAGFLGSPVMAQKGTSGASNFGFIS